MSISSPLINWLFFNWLRLIYDWLLIAWWIYLLIFESLNLNWLLTDRWFIITNKFMIHELIYTSPDITFLNSIDNWYIVWYFEWFNSLVNWCTDLFSKAPHTFMEWSTQRVTLYLSWMRICLTMYECIIIFPILISSEAWLKMSQLALSLIWNIIQCPLMKNFTIICIIPIQSHIIDS